MMKQNKRSNGLTRLSAVQFSEISTPNGRGTGGPAREMLKNRGSHENPGRSSRDKKLKLIAIMLFSLTLLAGALAEGKCKHGFWVPVAHSHLPTLEQYSDSSHMETCPMHHSTEHDRARHATSRQLAVCKEGKTVRLSAT